MTGRERDREGERERERERKRKRERGTASERERERMNNRIDKLKIFHKKKNMEIKLLRVDQLIYQ